MVASITPSEFAELIDSVQDSLRRKINIELNDIIDLSSAVKSYKYDLESSALLQSVVKLIFDIYNSGKVLNKATSDAVFLLLADCIMGTFNLLKKNNKECESLCNDIINLILVMSQRDQEAPNLLLKYLSNSLITILIYPKFDTRLKRDFLKIFNYILENSDRPLRYKMRNYKKLEKLWKLLNKCGDYDFQVNVIETIFRYTSMEDRKLNAKRWFSDNGLISGFLNIIDFEPDCRKFLNLFNCSLKNERLVYSIPCLRAIVGNCEIQKPEHPCYEEFWVDFNLGSKSLSLVCSQTSLYSNSVLASPLTPGLWETILIESHIIKKAHLQQSSLSMGSQRAEGNTWTLQLTLFQPCYAIFSSIACNFEGNLCTFMFSSSNAAVVDTVLQPIFGMNYFSDMGPARLKKKHCKSSVASSDIVCESDNSGVVTSINRGVDQLPKYPFKMKVSQTKENLEKETSKSHGGAPLLGNKIAERMANNRSFKENVKESQNKENTSKSKKQKSPFKPLEFIIPCNSNKTSNNSKNVSLDNSNQSTSKQQSSEPTLKHLIKEKTTAESISSVYKSNEECFDKVPVHDSSNYSKGNQKILLNENSSGNAKEDNCVILAEDTDDNSDIMKDSQPKGRKDSQKTVARRIVETSKNQPQEEFQGRVLRSHIKAQLLWDNKTPKKTGKRTPPINSNDRKISKSPITNLEAQLNDSDSDQWLKTRKVKSTKVKERAKSLGALHMKQLYNKEVAMEKAIRKREKSLNLKPSHNNGSDSVPPKKKLFNCKENSFLGFDGKIKRDKGNIASHSDTKDIPAETDNTSVNSINWFSENDSESNWMKLTSKSNRFASSIKERKQPSNQSKSKEAPNELGEQTVIQVEGTTQSEKYINNNVGKLSGVERDVINSCSEQMKVDTRNSVSSAKGDDNSRLQGNKRRKRNRRKMGETDEIHQKEKAQEIAASNSFERLESESFNDNSNLSNHGNEQISKSKKKQSLECYREEEIHNGEEPNTKSGCTYESNSNKNNSFQNEFEEYTDMKNRSVMKNRGEERLNSSKTLQCVQNSDISEDHLPLASTDLNNSTVNGRKIHSQDVSKICPKAIILSDNLSSDNPMTAKETPADNHKKKPLMLSTKQGEEANISSEESVRISSSRNINDFKNNLGSNHSDKHSDAKFVAENGKADSVKDLVEENGKSLNYPSSNDKIKENNTVEFTKQTSDLIEPQRVSTTNKCPEVIVLSEDDNPEKSENILTKEDEYDLSSGLSRNEIEVIVSSQINHGISHSNNENHLGGDQGMGRLDKIHNNSPDIIILSEFATIKSSPGTPKSVNCGKFSNPSSVKQGNVVATESTSKFNADLSCSVESQKNKGIKAQKNSLGESLLCQFSKYYELNYDNNSEGLILRPRLTPTNASSKIGKRSSEKLPIMDHNATTLNRKTVQAPEREDNLGVQEILSKSDSSPSLQNFGSDLDLDDLSLTEGDEKEDQNNSKSACSTFMYGREDRENQISAKKRILPPKRKSKGAKGTLMENKYKNHEMNVTDEKRDLRAHHSKRRRDSSKIISSPVEMNNEMCASTSFNLEKALNEFQEYDSNTDDLPQDVCNGLSGWPNSCQKQKLRKENNINVSKNSSGIQFKKRRIMEPEDIENSGSKVYQYDFSSFKNNCNFNSKDNKKKVSPGITGDSLSAKQQNFASETIPDLHQILKVRFEEKTRKMKELGNLFLKCTEDGLESLKENGHKIGSKQADEYLKKLNDEIIALEETIQDSVKTQEELEKCLKHISGTFSLKANIDSSAIERLKRTQLICEDMRKENMKVQTSDYVEKYNSKLSSKIKQLHHNYMKQEWKKELAKVQNQLKLFLHF